MPEWDRVVQYSPDVADALRTRRPLILLESAVISHGLPGEIALQTAADMAGDAAAEGVLAATVAVIDGRITVGASADALRRLITGGAVKVAERDLSTAVALRHTGGTTVSATLAIADLIGAPVVATGGIGGVHLEAGRTWDVSADLRALAAHPVAVVCAGAKAICDVPKTLEYLETAGVTVVGFRTDRFPYFFAIDSDCLAPRRIDSALEGAAVLAAKRALAQRGGLVIAHPIPAAEALDRVALISAVAQAQRDASAAGAGGGDLTPFLLARLADLTHGRSVAANIALLRANARLAAQVARAFAQQEEHTSG